MKMNRRLRLLFLTLLPLTALTVCLTGVRLQYLEKVDIIQDLLLQKNAILSQILRTAPMDGRIKALQAELKAPDWSRSFVTEENGRIFFNQIPKQAFSNQQLLSRPEVQQALSTHQSQGIVRAVDVDGSKLFLSFRFVPAVGAVFTAAPETLVRNSILYQSGLALLVTLLATGFGLLAFNFILNHLLGDLEKLTAAVSVFGEGHLTTRFNQNSSTHEIAQLAQSFNAMADKVADLFRTQQSKANLDAEIETARRVQQTFFPSQSATYAKYSLKSLSLPAQGCGGDWFHHYRNDEFLYLCIGDVTGHGLSSSLVTGVSRAAFSMLEDESDLTPSQLLTRLNRVIFKATEGRLQMTFLMVRIDLRNDSILFSNASHPWPLHLVRSNSKWTANFLPQRPGPRLGESLESNYTDATGPATEEGWLLLYTDGLPEMLLQDGRVLGDRKLIQQLGLAVRDSSTAFSASEYLEKELARLRGDKALTDDLTWMLICKNR